jgi:predicted Fe-Mo cluster-binding NifX family protein
MKIAIASQNQKKIFEHAGKATKFLLYTVNEELQKVETKELLEINKEDILHKRFHESDNPSAPHPLFDVDIVITRGGGPAFVNGLAAQNTKVIITSETEPDVAVTKLLAGTLPQLPPEQHHHHHH